MFSAEHNIPFANAVVSSHGKYSNVTQGAGLGEESQAWAERMASLSDPGATETGPLHASG
jgi:hypothetical protein